MQATALLFGTHVEPIRRVRVTLMRRDEVRDSSAVEITRPIKIETKAEANKRRRAEGDTSKPEPVEVCIRGTVNDARFGIDGGGTHAGPPSCETCNRQWRKCSSHAGCMPTDAPMLNVVTRVQLRQVIACCAPKPSPMAFYGPQESGLLVAYQPCARARVKRISDIRSARAEKRLGMLAEDGKPSVRGRNDNKRKRGVTWDIDFGTGAISAVEYGYGDGDEGVPMTFSALEIFEILKILTPFDYETMGIDRTHVDLCGLMFDSIPVLPAPMRPASVRDKKSHPHPFTTAYNQIATYVLQKSGDAPKRRNRTSGLKIGAARQRALSALLDSGAIISKRAKMGAQQKIQPAHKQSMHDVLKGKKGMFRMNCVGKRVSHCTRSNTVGCARLRHGEVGIPFCLAENMVVFEPVNPWSRSRVEWSSGGDVMVLDEVGGHAAPL